jgi:hypothetical protein
MAGLVPAIHVFAPARPSRRHRAQAETQLAGYVEAIKCCICEHSFEPEDMASCPAYAGPICSLCCSLDARWHDLCMPHARIQSQVSESLGALLPQAIYRRINSQLGHYLAVFTAGLVALTLSLIYLQTSVTMAIDPAQISDVLWKAFFALTIIIGVVAWLFVLARQSRQAAEAETRRQTTLLMQEIDAHGRTDAELQRAKEAAESANLAKSRHVVGLSHELRSPLNAISGYAQLLEQDLGLPPKSRDQVRQVRRSAEHLSGLIDGLLDISKIEAGRLYLSRDEVRLGEFLDQLVGMFRLHAAAKNIDFIFERPPWCSPTRSGCARSSSICCPTRSNSPRKAASGSSCTIAARWPSSRSATPAPASIPAIWNGSLRRSNAARSACRSRRPAPGWGSPGVMGGDIRVSSAVGKSSTFYVKMLLSEVTNPTRHRPIHAPVYGYYGPRKTILVTDDAPPSARC